jgi:hypothetical protein
MKSLIFFFISMGFVLNLNSQRVKYSEDYILYEDKNTEVVKVEVFDSRIDIQKVFTKWMNERYNQGHGEVKILKDETNTYSAIGCVFPGISDEVLDVYMKVEYGLADQLILRFYTSHGIAAYVKMDELQNELVALHTVVEEFVNNYLVSKNAESTSRPSILMQ